MHQVHISISSMPLTMLKELLCVQKGHPWKFIVQNIVQVHEGSLDSNHKGIGMATCNLEA